MTTYWDILTVNIQNNSGLDLTVGNVPPLPHGEWDSRPVSSVRNGTTASPGFAARSVNAAEVGPGPGTVAYDLPDGTVLNIQFDMIFAVAQPTYVSAQTSGAAGGAYTVNISCSQDWWHGQGKRFNATLVLALGRGHNSDQCTKSP